MQTYYCGSAKCCGIIRAELTSQKKKPLTNDQQPEKIAVKNGKSVKGPIEIDKKKKTTGVLDITSKLERMQISSS